MPPPRVMPEIQPQLAKFTVELLERRGIDFRLSTQVKEVHDNSVVLSNGEMIPARTVCWTAGVKASPVAEQMGLRVGGRANRLQRVDARARLRQRVGGRRRRRDPRPGAARAAVPAHSAARDPPGQAAGKNVAATLGARGQVKPFTFKTLGSFAELGRHKAVANLMGVRVRGFLAWAICRFYHLAWMPGLDRKSRLIADWTTEFIFPRDIAELGQLGHPPRWRGRRRRP